MKGQPSGGGTGVRGYKVVIVAARLTVKRASRPHITGTKGDTTRKLEIFHTLAVRAFSSNACIVTLGSCES
jgi:hypothetical protein